MALLTTRQAAQLWGCSPDKVRYHLRAAGLVPLRGDTTMYEGRTLYWRAEEVQRALAERGPADTPARPPTTKELRKMNADAAARRALMREQVRERWGNYWRAKAEARAKAKAEARAAARAAKEAAASG
jgi:hypothetical protein